MKICDNASAMQGNRHCRQRARISRCAIAPVRHARALQEISGGKPSADELRSDELPFAVRERRPRFQVCAQYLERLGRSAAIDLDQEIATPAARSCACWEVIPEW